jgi:hypothetical protein
MPRKLRCISLMLVVALSAGITCQAAHASPVAPRSVGADFSGGDFLATVWSWFAAKAEGLGSLMSGNPRPGAIQKDTSTSDPNNGAVSNNNGSKPCAIGAGGSAMTLQP